MKTNTIIAAKWADYESVSSNENGKEDHMDWTRWEERAKRMDNAALAFAATDAREAAVACRGWNPEKEGYYDDQASIFAAELRRRVKK